MSERLEPGGGPRDEGERDPGEALLAHLAAATAADRPPPDVVEAAKAAFTWRTIDAELAELAYDSLVDAAAGVRSTALSAPRRLSFEAGDVVIEVEVEAVGELRRLEGQVVPAEVTGLELQQPGAEASTLAVDELGRFRVDGVRPGPLRLRCRLGPDAGDVLTAWVSV